MKGKNLNKVRPGKLARLKALGVEALEEGETSFVARVRLPKPAGVVFYRLSARERGQVVEAGLKALGVDYGKEEG